ncbi:MAG: hypothetical protein DCC58_07640 [Chloroflexi bacterium]|nr:MAG: hypothetical protein DCC58_07640 [Chloroflexota bacterium]
MPAMPRIGMLTIGQTPRDDIVPEMVRQIGVPVEVLQRGAIDGLSLAEVLELAPQGDEQWSVSRMTDGTEVRLAMRELIPRMQQRVEELEAEGVDLIVPLCASTWSALRVGVPFINSGVALNAIVMAMVRPGGTLGVVAPTEAQAELAPRKNRFGELPLVATYAQPYLADPAARREQCAAAGRYLADAGVDLIYMSCMGHTGEMRAAVRSASGLPTLTANALIAGLIAQAIA